MMYIDDAVRDEARFIEVYRRSLMIADIEYRLPAESSRRRRQAAIKRPAERACSASHSASTRQRVVVTISIAFIRHERQVPRRRAMSYDLSPNTSAPKYFG